MQRTRRLFPVLGLAFGILSVPSVGHSQTAENSVLVVGVSKGTKVDQRLTRALSEHLERTGQSSVITENLSSSERRCSTQECYEPIAQRTNAKLLLSAQIQQNEPGTYYIQMGMFDAVRLVPYQASASCERCGTSELLSMLSDTADKLIQQSRKAQVVPSPSTAKPAPETAAAPNPEPVPATKQPDSQPAVGSDAKADTVTTEPAKEPSEPSVRKAAPKPDPTSPSASPDTPALAETPRFNPYSGDRRALIGVLTALSMVGIAAGVTFQAFDQGKALMPNDAKCPTKDDPSADCIWNTKPAYAVGYGFAAASLIGLTIALATPNRPNQEQPKTRVVSITLLPSSKHSTTGEVR